MSLGDKELEAIILAINISKGHKDIKQDDYNCMMGLKYRIEKEIDCRNKKLK